MDSEILYTRFLESTGVSTDTRKITPGSIFFALKGPNFNANTLAEKAIELGAKYAVIDEKEFQKNSRFLLVDDALDALQKLAKMHRRSLGIPIIAITGSNGKTTTKELVNAVLKTKYKTYATLGNLNNHIGVPLTLLAMDQTIELGIVEMGANHQGEIISYCQIAEPTHGLITNIGKAHLEGFGGFEGVKKGKGELYKYLSENKGKIFMNSADAILQEIPKETIPVTYPAPGDFFSCTLVNDVPFVVYTAESRNSFTTHLPGKYNFDNIAAALCIGKFFNVQEDLANSAVASYDPKNNRSERIVKNTNNILLDAYNANPSSMKAAIENFSKLDAFPKVLVLGDMFELGEESKSEHTSLGKLISGYNFDTILLCGKEMEEAKKQLDKAHYFINRDALENWIKNNPFKNSTIFIKGSRGMGLEKILEFL